MKRKGKGAKEGEREKQQGKQRAEEDRYTGAKADKVRSKVQVV